MNCGIALLNKKSSRGLLFGLVLIVQACNLMMEPVTQKTRTAVPSDKVQEPSPTIIQDGSQTETPQALPLTTETKRAERTQVTVTAVDGNLFIRRGPHLAFNPIGVLYDGMTVTAVGRDMLSRWVQVGQSSQAGSMGWISIQTSFSKIAGEITSLPVIDTTDWPAGAFIRNCTHHQMLAQPGDHFLPSSYEFPDNEVSVFPGIYSVYDLDVPDKPVLIEMVEVREGVEVDIREDAEGERRKCP